MFKYKGPRYWFRHINVIRNLKKIGQKPLSILEIGAGTLELSSQLAKDNNVVAVDLSNNIYESYKSLPIWGQNNLKVIAGDFLDIDFKDKKFDIVIAMEVLEHVSNEEKFLDKINHVIKDKGCVVISVPAHQSLWSKHDEAVGHVRRYEKVDLVKIVNKFNYQKFMIFGYGWPWINILRYLRIWSTKIIYHKNLDQKGKTVFSGERIKGLNILSIFINKYTIFPFFLVSCLFENKDWSEGYLLYLYKK